VVGASVLVAEPDVHFAVQGVPPGSIVETLKVLNQTSRYEPPAVPPFVLRPVELPIVNPIAEEHREIEAFLAENLSAGTAANPSN
jgi:hypothetical protein